MGGSIVRDGATGQAIVAATGTPVDSILEALESGDSRGDVLRAHPGLTVDDLVAAVRFARSAVQRQGRDVSSEKMCEPLRTYADLESAMLSARRERQRLACRLELIERLGDGLAQAASGFAEVRD